MPPSASTAGRARDILTWRLTLPGEARIISPGFQTVSQVLRTIPPKAMARPRGTARVGWSLGALWGALTVWRETSTPPVFGKEDNRDGSSSWVGVSSCCGETPFLLSRGRKAGLKLLPLGTATSYPLQKETMRRTIFSLVVFCFLLALAGACAGPGSPSPNPAAPSPAARGQKLILATTTSTYDSGLLDYLLPDFERQYNVKVEVVAVGTGQAIKLGQDGNADVLLVHARAQEDAFMAAGHGTRREDVMYNDFVLLGPPSDPAGIKGLQSAAEALAKIAQAQAKFISRGDGSGTHVKEKALWQAANLTPAGGWYIAAGQGMGEVLTMAEERQAYTLSDRATYLARKRQGLSLEILVEGDPTLFNPYGVIAINPNKGAHIQAELANAFIDWLVSLPTQHKIAEFGVAEFGAPLFVPNAAAWRAGQQK